MAQPAPIAPPPAAPARELDELTLKRAQRGEAAACRALVDTYQHRVFAFLSRMVGPGRREFCEDVAQDTFLDVFRTLENFSPLGPARLSSYILCIASRRAIDRLRRDRLEPTATTDEELSELARAVDSPTQHTVARQIGTAIQKLRPEYRVILLLRDVHGLSYSEIARAQNLDDGTVKSRLSRARTQVRDLLAQGSHD